MSRIPSILVSQHFQKPHVKSTIHVHSSLPFLCFKVSIDGWISCGFTSF